MFFPAVSSYDFRNLAEHYRKNGDIENQTKCLKQADALDAHFDKIRQDAEKTKQNDSSQIIAHSNNHPSKLTDRQWKICTIVAIITFISLSAIVFGLEYYGFLYRR